MRGDRELQAQPAPLWQVRFLAMHVSPHAFPVLQTLQQFDPAPPHEVAPSAPVGTKIARTNQSVRKRLRISFIALGYGGEPSGLRTVTYQKTP